MSHMTYAVAEYRSLVESPELVIQDLEKIREANVRRIEEIERENDRILDIIEALSEAIIARRERDTAQEAS